MRVTGSHHPEPKVTETRKQRRRWSGGARSLTSGAGTARDAVVKQSVLDPGLVGGAGVCAETHRQPPAINERTESTH